MAGVLLRAAGWGVKCRPIGQGLRHAAAAGHGGRISHAAPLRAAASPLPPAAAGFPAWSASSYSSASGSSVSTASIRDIAIIAHVDHGKTTLMDQLLKACGGVSSMDRVMDSISIERERGITIAAKYTSFEWGGININAVDTPGHSDFGGEVERALDMVDGCVLLVDASEGPLAQTKFVLGKALAKGLRPLVVLNKVDRERATPERCAMVESDIFDLFANLGATEEQLDFPTIYASAKDGWATLEHPLVAKDAAGSSERTMAPLLDAIRDRVPAPPGDADAPFTMLVSMLERNSFIGRIAVGRVTSGRLRVGDRVTTLKAEGGAGPVEQGKVTRILRRVGTEQVQIEEAVAGDIVGVAGLELATVTDTVASAGVTEPVPSTPVDPPTISMTFGANSSPLAGREGTQLTGSKIGDYLKADAETNVSLRVTHSGNDAYEVQGRGEVQLGVLIENMRRAGFELSVSPPQVVLKEGPRGERLEPMEEVVLELEDGYAGACIERLTLRKAELVEMGPSDTAEGRSRLVFRCPSRGLIGFSPIYHTITSGTGLIHRSFLGYEPWKGALDRVRKGALVSMADGKTTLHALGSLESRGTLFVGPGTEVYGGCILGEHAKDADLEVNPVREKKLTNVRASGTDETVRLRPPRDVSLEEAIGWVNPDEVLEITPGAVRLRKRELDASRRKVLGRAAA